MKSDLSLPETSVRRITNSVHQSLAKCSGRIVQCKMILKRDLIPMQDDTENGGGLTGELRPNARTHADRRDIESRSDQPVFETGRHHRICRTEPRRRYAFAQQLLVAQEYARQGKKQRGAIRAYLSKMTGLSLPPT